MVCSLLEERWKNARGREGKGSKAIVGAQKQITPDEIMGRGRRWGGGRKGDGTKEACVPLSSTKGEEVEVGSSSR